MDDLYAEQHVESCPGCRHHAHVSRRAFLGGSAVAGIGLAAAPLVSWSPARAATAPAPEMASRPWPAPAIVSRAGWGCDESLRIAKQGGEPPIYDSTVKKIIVHHTATPNNPSDPAATVRGIYNYHVSGVYIDIAYNFLIDQNGTIYEGRWSRDLAPGQVPTGENAFGQQVRGAHAINTNQQTIGIALLGTFSGVSPTTAAIEALISLVAWKCARWGIDPKGYDQYIDGRFLPSICGHRDTSSTECPGAYLGYFIPYVQDRVAAVFNDSTNGYWIALRDGSVRSFGDCADFGDPRRSGIPTVLQGLRPSPTAAGLWALGTDGGIFTYGATQFYGSTGGMRLNQPVVGMGVRPQGDGYWLVARDGGVFTFGNARFFGSTGSIRLNQPIVGMAPTRTGNGYWLVASDGGIFCFGDAAFWGSTGSIRLNQPIVGMAAHPSGLGYWLCAADGGIFTFGNAPFLGSTGDRRLPAPIVDFAATPRGKGYWMLGADGSVYAFGDAPYHGNAVGAGAPAVGFAPRLKT